MFRSSKKSANFDLKMVNFNFYITRFVHSVCMYVHVVISVGIVLDLIENLQCSSVLNRFFFFPKDNVQRARYLFIERKNMEALQEEKSVL